MSIESEQQISESGPKTGSTPTKRGERATGHSVEHFAAMNAELIRTAAALSAVATAANLLDEHQHARTMHERLEHLASGAFVVAIVGEFKRGKSTLANALLGAEVMPADVLPATAAVNRVVFGREPAVTLRFHEGHEQTIPINELGQYVSKLDDESAARATALAEAVVAYPTHLCRHNVELLDTPGLGDEAAMTERTVRAIAGVDAAVMVTSALSPFAQTEAEILEDLLQHVDPSRLFFVLGQIDLLAPPDVDRVVAAVERRIRKALPASAPAPRVLPVSARDALHAKLERDQAKLAASRFEAFEHALERFLVRDRGVAVVQAANEALVAVSAQLVTAAEAKLAAIERAESLADERVREREQALAELAREARELESGLSKSADAVRVEGGGLLATIAEPITNTAKHALGQLQFTQTEVTHAPDRHGAVEQQLAPRVRALLEHLAGAQCAALLEWTRQELRKLQVLSARLEALLDEDRGAAGSARAPQTADLETAATELLGDCQPLLEIPQEFKLSYVPSSVVGTINSLAGEIAGNAMVRRVWEKAQGKSAQRVAEERTAMMVARMLQDYSAHLDSAIPTEVRRIGFVGRYERVWKQLTDKVALKVRGDVELVAKVCEIRPWELRVARQKARAEREREIERIHGALRTAEAAAVSGRQRIAMLKDYLGAATQRVQGEA